MPLRLLPIGLCLLFLSIAAPAEQTAQSDATPGLATIRHALQHILDSNAQYVAEHRPEYFAVFTEGQRPLATVVSCSDSRVHSHALDKTPDNDIFVIRNIGNQLTTAEGSVEYGVHHLHTPLLLFVGHSACGAVTAAVGDYSKESHAIKRELDTIKAIKGGDVTANIISNVDDQVAAALKKFASEVEQGSLAVVGAVYDFRDDLGKGQGKLTIINVNGQTDAQAIRHSPAVAGLEHLSVLERGK